jgi:predicted O-methyltransferase YrrM
MRDITYPPVDKYLYALLPKRDAVLREMEAYARRNNVPIIGPAVARVLALLVQISDAKRIFEMGSAIGYSTIWLARAAGRGAEVHYTDGNSENARRAQASFRRAGVSGRIRIHVGDALKSLDGTTGKFDAIFIDVDKHQYPAALRKALPRLKRGGLLFTDNVLWSGRVVKRAADRNTRAIQEFNRAIYASKKLFPVIIPLRDGVAVCRKG